MGLGWFGLVSPLPSSPLLFVLLVLAMPGLASGLAVVVVVVGLIMLLAAPATLSLPVAVLLLLLLLEIKAALRFGGVVKADLSSAFEAESVAGRDLLDSAGLSRRSMLCGGGMAGF